MGAYSSNLYYPSNLNTLENRDILLSTNIILIPYSIILTNKDYQTQVPNYCRGCGAAINMFSILVSSDSYSNEILKEIENEQEKNKEEETKEDINHMKVERIKNLKSDESVWICEFCGTHNRLPADLMLPQNERQLYLLRKNQTQTVRVEEIKYQTQTQNEDQTLVFCIDVSGSMSREHKIQNEDGVEHIPRIKLITNEILNQLKEMRELYPHKKIGIVLFGSKVVLKGDCSRPSLQLSGDLENFDIIFNEIIEKGQDLISKSLSENYTTIEDAIKEITVGGGTALGPGLLSALGLAAQGKRGSRIILCTDGLANIGIGCLENADDVIQSKGFYDKLGDIAVEKGISISIITVKGQACKVEALGPLTDRTAGQIIRIDPANFNLANLAANNLIATDVKLKAIVHESLAFKNERSNDLQNDNSVLIKHIGSVSTNNEAYFEYCFKGIEELQKIESKLEKLEYLPLQIQILYNDLQGNEFILIITRRQKITRDQKEAEKDVKAEILTTFVQKQSANLVLDGKVEEARKNNLMWVEHVDRISNSIEMDTANKKALESFKTENLQLQIFMDVNSQQLALMDDVQRDEITSKLYEIKQKKNINTI